MNPTVSVVIPTRDRPEMLRRALDSVLASAYDGEIECLVVFDQSEPDRSLDRDGPARRVRVLANDRAQGLAGARNTGALAATGTFVAQCDDDDEWLPAKLDAQVALLAGAPEVDVVTTGIFVHAGERVTTRVLGADRITFTDLVRSRVMEAHPSTFLVRREALLERIGLVDEQLPGSYGEDYEWLLRAARLADVAAVRQPLARVHWHASSYFTDRWRTIVAALDYLVAAHPELRDDPRGLARIEAQQAFAQAAMHEPRSARRTAIQALRRDRTQKRAYLALLASTGIVRPEHVLRLAHAAGRGV